MKIKIIKKDDNHKCWYNQYVGQEFTVKAKPNFDGAHKNAVIVRTPCHHDGWVCAGDYELVSDKTTKSDK